MIPDGHDWLDVATVVIALIAAVGGLGALVGWVINRRKTGAEARKTDAETAELYQKIADSAAVKALKHEERISALEEMLRAKDQRIDELEAANQQKDREIEALRCQIDLLQQKVDKLEGKRK